MIIQTNRTHIPMIAAGWLLVFCMAACSSSKSKTDAGADAGDGGVQYQGAAGDTEFLGPWGGAATRIEEDPTQNGRVFGVVGGALFVSEDSGETWSEMDIPTDSTVYSVLPLADGRIFVGTDFEILLSDDGGASWVDIRGNMEQGLMYNISITGIAYEAGTPDRMWVSLGGMYETAPIWYLEGAATSWTTWNEPSGWDIDPLNGDAHFESIAVGIDGVSGDTVIFATYGMDFGAGGGVFCSTDSGATFTNCSGGLPDYPYHRVRVLDDRVVIAGGQIFGNLYIGINYSDDFGGTWSQSAGGWSNPIADDFIRLAGGDYLAAAYGSGLMRTSDLAGSWSSVGGFGEMSLNTVAELSNGHILVGPEQFGVQRSEDDAASFSQSSQGLNRVVIEDASMDPSNTSALLCAINSQNSGLVLRTDNGADGWGVATTDGFPRFSYVYISPFGKWYVVSDGPTGQANDGIFVSDDQGGSFQFLGPLDGSSMDHIDIRVFEGESEGHLIAAGNFWVAAPFIVSSDDGGQSWDDVWSSEGDSNNSMQDFAILPDGDMLVASLGEPIVRVTAQGDATTLDVPGVIDGIVLDLAACANDPDRVFAVGRANADTWANGLFATTDGGATWDMLILAGFPNASPYLVETHPLDCNIVFVATWDGLLIVSDDGGASWSEIDIPLAPVVGMKTIEPNSSLESQLIVFGTGGIVGLPLIAQQL